MTLRQGLLLVALASFAAGMASGLALTAASKAAPSATGLHDDFIRRFASEYELTTQQVRDLRAVFLMYDDERMRIATSFEVDRWPAEARSQIEAAGRRKQERVIYLLDQTQRAKYLTELAK